VLSRQFAILLTVSALLASGSVLNAKDVSSLIEFLNQDSRNAREFPHVLNENLTKVVAEEKRDMQEAWKLHRGVKTKKERNAFFHLRVNALNRQTWEWVETLRVATGQSDFSKVAAIVQSRLAEHPIAKPESAMDFDRGSEIGFCFGRALLAHYELLKRGVPQEAIVKLFVLGDLKVGHSLWKFHVAVGVRDPEKGLWVIDPLQPSLSSLVDWVQQMEKLDLKSPNPSSRFFVTDARKFLPAGGAYQVKQLLEPPLKPYFSALLGSL
jgi:hypothetical protein